MPAKQIAFVTYSDKPAITDDDALLIHYLNEQGIIIEPAAWDDPAINWKRFDLVLVRSCWNYHLKPVEFRKWINQLESDRINVQNPASILKWNLHKSYLQELNKEGIEMAKTVWIKRGERIDLPTLFEELGSSTVVVKPCIAATAYQTFLVSTGNLLEREEKINSLIQQQDVMIQEFIPEVQTEGEWSLIFFNKEFSHAVLKKPKLNDFRVQNDFGGTSIACNPDKDILAQASVILSHIPSPLLYARIDGVVSNKRFLLMELELIEPMLFLESSKSGTEKLAVEIMRLLD